MSSQLLFTSYSVEVPTTQAFLNYLLLGFLYGVPVVMRKDFCSILRKNWWKYIFLGLIDVEANYLIILAYKYTNLTTIQVKGSGLVGSLALLFLGGVCFMLLNQLLLAPGQWRGMQYSLSSLFSWPDISYHEIAKGWVA